MAAITSQIVSIGGSATVPTSGDVAHDAVDSGNPVKIGFKAYDPSSLPSDVAANDRANGISDLKGRQIIYDGTLRAGENQTTNKQEVEHNYTPSGVLTSDTQVKASAGFVHSVTISCNDAAPTAGSFILYNNTAESGTQIFNHTFTTTPFAPFTVILDMVCSTGIYAGFTTTADVNVSISYR